YNYIVQHNPTPAGFQTGPGNAYVTDLRDKKHGRVYRVVYGPEVDPISLEDASTEKLIETLAHPNMFWRRHAQRLLIEKNDQSAVDSLITLALNRETDSVGLSAGSIHALRTLHWLAQLENPKGIALLRESLHHPSPGVVRTAIEILPRNLDGQKLLLESGAFESKDPQVRLATLLALAQMPESPNSAAVAYDSLAALMNRSDPWMRDAAIAAAAANSSEFLVLACGNESVNESAASALAIVAEHMARSVDGQAVAEVIGVLAKAPSAARSAIIAGWTKGWPAESPANLPVKADQELLAIFDTLDASGKGQLIRLAAAFGSQTLAQNAKMIADSLLKIATDEEAEGQSRVDASTELFGLMSQDGGVVRQVLKSITGRTDQETAVGMMQALQRSRADSVGQSIVESIATMTPATRSTAIRVMLARAESTEALLDALAVGHLDRTDLALDQQQALLTHPQKRIRDLAKEVLTRSGGVPNADRVAVLEGLMEVTKQKGDVMRGKLVYAKNCANCHKHRGEGNQVGPDLTGMAVHPKEELLTHIIDPSRSVEGNYRSYSVLTVDGIVINGLLASETQTAIEVYDAQGKKQVVLREDIEQLVASKKSVMPEGFEKQIDAKGFTDLLEFLTDKGDYLPLPLNQAATAISTKGLFHSGDNGPDRIVFNDWSPKMVGQVPFQLIDPQG
ncbi:MAG: c-type cytochrome, partial [Rubripirellula sp.]